MVSTSSIRRWAAALVLAVLCLGPVAASAQVDSLTEEQIEELKLWLSKANRLYDEGDYAGALKRYREGLDIAELPEIQYRMATCYEKLDRYAEAVKAYQRFLVLDPDAPERGRVEADIARLKDKLKGQAIGELEITSEPAGAMVVLLDDKENPELGKTPVTTPLPGGPVTIRVELDGYEAHTQTVEVPRSGKALVTVALAPIVAAKEPVEPKEVVPDPIEPPEEPRPVVDDGFDFGLWGWITTGVGVVTGGASAVLFFVTNGTIADYNNYDRRGPGASRAEFENLADDIATQKTATVWTGIAAGVLLAGGVTMLVIDGSSEDESVRLDVGPDGTAVFVYELRW